MAQVPQTLYVAEIDSEFLILLPPPLKSWDGSHVPPHPVSSMLGVEPRVLCVVDKHCPKSYMSCPYYQFFSMVE